jgi:hypothetical protein
MNIRSVLKHAVNSFNTNQTRSELAKHHYRQEWHKGPESVHSKELGKNYHSVVHVIDGEMVHHEIFDSKNGTKTHQHLFDPAEDHSSIFRTDRLHHAE